MSKGMWIMMALFAAMAIAMMYQESNGGINRPWDKCKENLLTQIISDQCTPRTGGFGVPSGDGAPATDAPVDDGVSKVDRGG